MRRYNVWRPIIIIAVALVTNGLVTNLSVLFGAEPNLASNLGYIAMMIAALLAYTRMMKRSRK